MKSERFDLAILDYQMPKENGVSLAKSLREEMPTLPLILAASMLPERGSIPPDLFAEVILKPIHKKSFVMAVVRAITGKSIKVEDGPSHAPEIFASQNPLRILVVDDSTINLRLVTLMLRAAGYEPVIFGDANSALNYLKTHKIDVILMNVQMPEVDGHEATRRIRSGDAGSLNQDTQILALSAGAMEEERAACLAVGMNGFLAYPSSQRHG